MYILHVLKIIKLLRAKIFQEMHYGNQEKCQRGGMVLHPPPPPLKNPQTTLVIFLMLKG